MRHLVVDDKQLAAQALAEVICAVDPQGSIDVELTSAGALRAFERGEYDVAYLDIEMPGSDGLTLARQMQEIDERANIVFVTGYPGYALEAHGLYPSGFLVKPVVEADVERALSNLRHPPTTARMDDPLLQARCFGDFEVFADGTPLAFERSKTKELLAYLIDRHGAEVTVGEATAILWEDSASSASRGAQLRNLVHDLRVTLDSVGALDVLRRRRGVMAVNCSRIDCDYYRFEAGEREARAAWRGEYMSQYSWAEDTCAHISRSIGLA